MVWEEINRWVWISQCGRFKIERYVPGVIRDINLTRTGPDRFRILKCNPEWYCEIAPSETSLAVAKQVCETLNVASKHDRETLHAAAMHALSEES